MMLAAFRRCSSRASEVIAVTELKSWVKENATLVYFLIAQSIALISGGAWALSYMVNLENRVATLEIRGSPHLGDINNRLTVLESYETH